VPHLGRPECAHSNACVGFPCPSNAKSGSHNTLLPRGLRTGNVRLVPHAFALSVDTDERGRVTGVSYVVDEGTMIRRIEARAKVVVLSAGAIESARLLLASKNHFEPHGLGNAHDWVGRNLQGHIYVSATGLMSDVVEAGKGPGPTRVTSRYSHDNPDIVGGGILHDEFVLLPILFYKRHLPPGIKRWGVENKRYVRDAYRRTLLIYGPIQETPNPSARVTLDPIVRDRFGAPVARLSGRVHPESVRSAEFLRQRAVEWLEASGAERVWSHPIRDGHFLTAGQHQAGTCRMGHDPKESVTDPWGRVHGHDNLYCVDASLHVTNGGMNPSLTIMALAFRSAEHIARQL
jgi:choline dehydrogenase-like flavoprotein